MLCNECQVNFIGRLAQNVEEGREWIVELIIGQLIHFLQKSRGMPIERGLWSFVEMLEERSMFVDRYKYYMMFPTCHRTAVTASHCTHRDQWVRNYRLG